jgi:hypothetical protein
MKFDRSLGTLTPGIPSAERATVEGTDHLLWLTGHSSSSAATIEVIGQQTLQDRLSWLRLPAGQLHTSLSRMTDPRLQLLFAKGDAFQ